jgi:photosystem II stability/assembly factor-like uncharacterized protein
VVSCLAASLVTPIGAIAAPVSVGHSGWTWGDPTPQGESLNGVAFIGERGYAVGEFGTVLRSDDGGESWTGLPSGTRSDLSLVQEVDPSTVIVGGGCTVRESVDSGETFESLFLGESAGKCANQIASFSFLNASMGFIEQADGSIFLTTDGGQTLQPKRPIPLNGLAASKLDFISPLLGFALVGGSSGEILRTTDGGNSWTQVAASPAPLSDIKFVTATTAYAVGGSSTLLQSVDGGSTWTTLPFALPSGTPPLALTHISCSGPLNCVIATGRANSGMTDALVRTTDGGMTGTLVSAPQQNLLAVAFSTAPSVVAVGEGGATELSSDGGATFPNPLSAGLGPGEEEEAAIRLGQSPLDAYAFWPKGRIAATTNGGAIWNIMRVPTHSALTDVAFPTVQTGYALSHSGRLFHTTNGGLSWSILADKHARADSLLIPSANTVVLVGPAGVRRSSDGGASFRAVHEMVVTGHSRGRPVRTPLAEIDLSQGAEIAAGAMLAIGKDVFESTNGGGSWTLIPRPLRRQPVSAMSFLSATTGYEVSNERLFFTRNRGRSWREISSADVDDVRSDGMLSFSSPSDGYAIGDLAGNENVLLRTEDAGRTWAPEILGFPLGDVAAGGSVDYAASALKGGFGGRNRFEDFEPLTDLFATGEPITSLFETNVGGRSKAASALTLSISGSTTVTLAKLKRAGHRVRLFGTLSPALAGEVVTVKWSAASEHALFRWIHLETAVVDSAGRFVLSAAGITGTTDFVAQWTGNDLVSGAGSPAVRLIVSTGKHHRIRHGR